MHEVRSPFTEAPSDWPSTRLGDLAERVVEKNSCGEQNVLTISAQHGLVSQSEFFSRRVASDNLGTYYLLRHGDFAYNKSYSRGFPFGTIRRLERYERGVVSPLYICFRLSGDGADPDFARHYLDSGVLDEGLGLVAKEGVRNHGLLNVAVGDFFSLEVAMPPLPEQRRIAEILDTIDEAIRKTEEIIAKLKQVKQGLLHDLLTRGIDDNGELRDPDRHPEQFKDSSLGRIPKAWEVGSVGSHCAVHNTLRKPISVEERDSMVGPYPYYGPTGVLDHLDEYRVEGTFVLIGEDGDHFLKFSDWAMTQLVSGRFNVNNHAHILSGTLCRTDWIDCWFRHRDITLHLTRQGAGRFKLNKAGLLQLPIAVPSSSEQCEVRQRLDALEGRVCDEQETREKLRSVKQGLMEDLLTGRIRVSPLLAEAAQ